MAFCPSCGAQVQGAFCMRCGTPVAGNAPQQAPPPQQQYGQPQQPPYGQPQQQYGQPQYGQQPPAATGGLDQNVASALCYLFGLITGVLFLVLEPHNKNKVVRFHAFQSIFLHISLFVLYLALLIVFSIMRTILPYGAWVIFSTITPCIWLCFLGAWIFLMYKAYNNEMFKIPVIGDLAEKQA